jgi:ADP-ribosyl-[dinitrogen reductase] hydrolase
MTHCPGRRGPDAQGRLWQRDLGKDLDSLVRLGTLGLVSLIDDAEFAALGVAALPDAVACRLRWLHMPVANMQAPNARALAAWRDSGAWIPGQLRAGGRVVFHCAAGLGRTGTVVAKLLSDVYGLSASDAVARVRQVRPGTIESPEQEAFVHGGRYFG